MSSVRFAIAAEIARQLQGARMRLRLQRWVRIDNPSGQCVVWISTLPEHGLVICGMGWARLVARRLQGHAILRPCPVPRGLSQGTVVPGHGARGLSHTFAKGG